ncbi:hypothetical protein Pcinc_043442, partial [Petrolisthes cinctipes]
TFVLSPPVVACHDPNTFPDPHAFRPQRWLTRPTTNTNKINNNNNNKPNNINNYNNINNNTTTNKINNKPNNINNNNINTTTNNNDHNATTTPTNPPTPATPTPTTTTTTDGGRVHPYTIVAFGHGARMCPGRRLAEQEIYLAIIQLVKTYKMEVSGEKKPVGQVMRLNMMPDGAFSVIFTPRN